MHFPLNDTTWIEDVSAESDRFITEWITEYKQGSLERNDVLNAVEKIANYKGTPELIKEVEQRLT